MENLLDNSKIVEQLDKDGMYHRIIHMPEQAFMAYNETELSIPDNFKEKNLKNISKLVICGMGGSAISGDIAKAAFGKYLPVEVVKDYHIPFVDENALVIAMSYSGNTIETLTCLKQALETTEFVASVTSGGEVEQLIKGKFPYMKLPGGNPPRSAIAWLFVGLVRILELNEIVPNQAEVIKKVIANLIKKAGALCFDCPQEQNLAKHAANSIFGKIPIIYTSDPVVAPLAYRWKCQFNENSKQPAFSNTFPEMNHNEIVGWEDVETSKNFIPIILKRFRETEVYAKRIIAFKELLDKNKVEYLEFFLEGGSEIEEIFSLIYLGDMISYYLALLKQVDPTEIDYIDYLKKHI